MGRDVGAVKMQGEVVPRRSSSMAQTPRAQLLGFCAEGPRVFEDAEFPGPVQVAGHATHAWMVRLLRPLKKSVVLTSSRRPSKYQALPI